MAFTVTIPYEDYNKLAKDSADKENTVKLLKTSFTDDADKLLAVKSLLGVEEDTDSDDSADDSEPDNSAGGTSNEP